MGGRSGNRPVNEADAAGGGIEAWDQPRGVDRLFRIEVHPAGAQSSAIVSQDATPSDTVFGSAGVRWILTGALAPGVTGSVSYEVIVR